MNTSHISDIIILDSLNNQSPTNFIPNEIPVHSLIETYGFSNIAGLLFCGGVAVLAFFFLLLLVKDKKRIYLYYALFLIFMLFYGITIVKSTPILGEYPKALFSFNKRLIEPVTILSFSFYILFAIELVDIKNQNQKLYKFLMIFVYVCIIYSILYYLLFHYFFLFEQTVFIIARVVIFPASLFCLLWIQIKIKSPVKKYFLVGSIAYFIGSFVATVRFTTENIPFEAFYKIAAPIYFEMGIMVETLCFALALGHRISFLHYEKQQASEKLIHQLSINDKMVRNMNKNLELEITERTKEIIDTQSKLHEQERMLREAEYEKELAESEMLARRLQINPHFIFNCLNAIKYLIQSKQNQKASLYLVMFSKFIRMVLDSSEKNVIPLNQEMEIIESYLKLEKERFDNNFTYELHLTDDEKINKTLVPPLILQPFVENAIWHGLLNSPHENKVVKIEVTTKEDAILIVIDDNGIGRKETDKLSAKKLYKSMGIYLTNKRVELYNHNFNNVLNFVIIDKIDNNEISLGTRVEITIKKNEPKVIS